MKVYEHKGFINPARVRFALAEKGLLDQVEFVPVDVMAGEHRTPEFLAKNPSGLVPALELEDGTILSECSAITEYLDHLEGRAQLTGVDAKSRGYIHMIQRKIEDGLLEAVGNYFHFATDGLGPDIELYKNKDFGERRRETALRTMAYIDGLLEGQDYVAGNELTVADITAHAGFAFADFAGIETPAELTNVAAWKARINARPSVASLN